MSLGSAGRFGLVDIVALPLMRNLVCAYKHGGIDEVGSFEIFLIFFFFRVITFSHFLAFSLNL